LIINPCQIIIVIIIIIIIIIIPKHNIFTETRIQDSSSDL
jgi:hypothetical protein